MITTKDLRRGNMVKWKGTTMKVWHVLGDACLLMYVDGEKEGSLAFVYTLSIEPVELNVGHLDVFGFTLHPWGLVKGKFRMTKEYLFQVGNGFNRQLRYVHELENLYFSLTGTEINSQ